MKKNKNNILKILISIAFAIIIVNCHVVKADVTELQQDDKGRYCISTADDYYFFENNCDNKLYYKSTVVLTNDIEIINKEKTKYFRDSSTRFVDLDNAVIFFRGDNLVIRYQQYAIAPYSSGTQEIEFSKEEIREFLKEI